MNRPSHHSIILPGNGAGNGAPSEQLEQRASPTETGSKEDTAAASSTCISSSTFSCDEGSTPHPTRCRQSRWRLAREVVRGGEKKAQPRAKASHERGSGLRPPLGGVSRVGEGCVARLHLVPSRSGFARPARRGQGLFFPTGCGLRCAGAPACALEPAPQRPVGGDEEEGPAPTPCRSIVP